MADETTKTESQPLQGDPQVPAASRRPPFAVALIPLVAMALLLGVGYGVYRIKAQVLLIAAASLTAFLGLVLGFKWKDMERGIVESIHKAMPAILIMLSVGILVGSWMASGTIPMVIYYGLKLISPQYFLPTACLVSSVVSLASGTSWGTIGTIGVAFLGIAMGLGIPLGPAAGAVVAGAYFGDKMSPLSDIPNLATVISGSNLFDHIRHMLPSAVPAWLAGLAIYFFVGLGYGTSAARSETLDLILTTLRTNFRFSPLLLLPMAVIFYFAVAKKPTIPAMVLSSLVAAALAVLVQRIPLTDVATAMNSGLPARTGVELVDRLLAKGGMMSMMETQLIAFTAFAFGGIMQTTGCLAVILDKVMRFTRHVWSLVLTTVGAAILSAMITGSSYLSMILPADLLAPIFKRKGLAAKNLSRIIEESGSIIVPLIPWSMAGVYITGTLGVSTFSYLPWAFMNYLSVGILVLFGFTGWTMSPRVREDETQTGS
jgi:NhaC family Na+:H+ antiporter